jgi:hypothetical protein
MFKNRDKARNNQQALVAAQHAAQQSSQRPHVAEGQRTNSPDIQRLQPLDVHGGHSQEAQQNHLQEAQKSADYLSGNTQDAQTTSQMANRANGQQNFPLENPPNPQSTPPADDASEEMPDFSNEENVSAEDTTTFRRESQPTIINRKPENRTTNLTAYSTNTNQNSGNYTRDGGQVLTAYNPQDPNDRRPLPPIPQQQSFGINDRSQEQGGGGDPRPDAADLPFQGHRVNSNNTGHTEAVYQPSQPQRVPSIPSNVEEKSSTRSKLRKVMGGSITSGGNDSFEEQIPHLNAIIKQLNAKNRDLEAELKDAKALQRAEDKQSKKDLKADNKRLEEDNARLRRQNAELEYRARTEENKRIQEVADRQKKVDTMVELAGKQGSENDKQNTKLEYLRSEIAQLNQRNLKNINGFNDTIESLRKEHKRATDDLNRMNQNSAGTNSRIKQMEAEASRRVLAAQTSEGKMKSLLDQEQVRFRKKEEELKNNHKLQLDTVTAKLEEESRLWANQEGQLKERLKMETEEKNEFMKQLIITKDDHLRQFELPESRIEERYKAILSLVYQVAVKLRKDVPLYKDGLPQPNEDTEDFLISRGYPAEFHPMNCHVLYADSQQTLDFDRVVDSVNNDSLHPRVAGYATISTLIFDFLRFWVLDKFFVGLEEEEHNQAHAALNMMLKRG